MAGALDGIMVADFSRVLAGPYATMLLADHGADVIKVESPAGDTTRGWGPPFASDGQTTYFGSVNRNKRSVALDLTTHGDRELARRLAVRADVVIENLMPGKLADFGLGYDAVRAQNPGVVYCSISGFGSEAGAQLPGFDLLVQAMGGLMSVTGISEPTRAGVAVVDVLTGLHANVGILAALRERERSGQGQRVEVTLLGTLLSSLVNQSSAFVGGGVVPGHTGNAHPSIAPYQLYEASDRSIVVAAGTDRQFDRLVHELGLAELASDPRFRTNAERVSNLAGLNAALTPVFAQLPAANWVHRLTGVGVPCGPVNNIGEAFALAEQLGLQPTAPFESSQQGPADQTVANPAGMSTTPIRYRTAPPRLDQDGDDIRQWLAGLDQSPDHPLRS
ncbi:MAG: CaiB/BaiF CoA transferase family protein [Candidatus Nanopelagicales bacterium]